MDGLKRCSQCRLPKERTEYSAKSGKCKPCVATRVAAYKASHPEIAKATADRYRANNLERIREKERARAAARRAADPDRERARLRAIYEADPERKREQTRAWIAANPGRRQAIATASAHRRRADGAIETDTLVEILARAQGRCEWCNEEAKVELDHAIPVSRGGTNDTDNLVASCRSCNASKGNSLPSEWVPRYWRDRIAAEGVA